jgi:PAS domain S-box-containing protein
VFTGVPQHTSMDINGFYEVRPVTTVTIGVHGEERGRIVSASPTFGELVGCTSDALIGRSLMDFVHLDDQGRAQDAFDQLVHRGSAVYDGVGRLVSPNGAVRWSTVHVSKPSDCEREQLLVLVAAMPVRLLQPKDANERRTSSTDRLGVALDFEPVASVGAAA